MDVALIARKRKRAEDEPGDFCAGPPRKISATVWASQLDNLKTALASCDGEKLAQRQASVRRALRAMGACTAAACRATRLFMDLHNLSVWLASRTDGVTRAELRICVHTECPDECKQGAGCAWRIKPEELAPEDAPRFVAIDASADSAAFINIGALPGEIIAHIARALAYDFGALRNMRMACRGLRNAVDAAFPSILVDCGIIARDSACGAWAPQERVLPRNYLPPAAFTKKAAMFRNAPCDPKAGRMLGNSGAAILALSLTPPFLWREFIAKETWGVAYNMAFPLLMNPFASPDEIARISKLVHATKKIGPEWGNGYVFHSQTTVEQLQARIACLELAPSVQARMDALLAELAVSAPCVCEARHARAFARKVIAQTISEVDGRDVAGTLDECWQRARALLCTTAEACAAELAASGMSAVFFPGACVGDADLDLRRGTGLERAAAQGVACAKRAIARHCPDYTGNDGWGVFTSVMRAADISVDSVQALAADNYVARALLVKFVEIVKGWHPSEWRNLSRLRDAWAPFERAMRASAEPRQQL